MSNKILVTGGAGFIGSHLVDFLMKQGNEVVVLDDLSAGSELNISNWLGHRAFSFVKGSLLRMAHIEQAIRDCDVVFHLAGNPDVRVGAINTQIHYEQNILCTYNLLESMKRSQHCKTIIFTSTSTIYGEANVIPTPEHYGPLMPISLYGASKLACESLISAYSFSFDFRSAIIRLANVIGHRSNHGVVFDFIHKLIKDAEQLEILGDGKQNKSYLHVEDCISAMTRMAQKLDQNVLICNAGSTDRIQVTDIARIIIEEMHLHNIRLNFTGGTDGGRGWKGDVKEMMLDTSKLTAMGWKPKYSSAEAIRSTTKSVLQAIQYQ